MKNYALNLEKRMMKTFDEHERLFMNYPIQIYYQNTEVCNIALQELSKEYDRFRRNRTLKDEIVYYKECYPVVAKWDLYFRYILELEESLFISHDDLKIKTYKSCISKLSNDFKKKRSYLASY